LNRSEIIQHLTKVDYIKNTCKIAGDLSDDLFQHTWVKILELKEETLLKANNNGYLQFYIQRMIISDARNPKNPFLKQLTSRAVTNDFECIICLNEDYDIESDKLFEVLYKAAIKNIESLTFYERKLFEMYLDTPSYRKLGAKIGIKYGSIHKTVTKVKKKLIESINS